MSNKNNKNKKRIRKITPLNVVIWVCAILLVASGTFLAIRLVKASNKNTEITPEELARLSTQAIAQYPYSMLVLDSQTTVNGETTTCEYVFTTSLNDSLRTYMMRDEEEVGYQCWLQNSEGTYDVYLYDDVYQVWVKTVEEYEPVGSNTWMVVADLSNYTLLEETDYWGEDECYVCQITGNSNIFEVIYEEIYIRKSDYMPMGILSYGVSSADGDRIQEIDPATFGDNVTSADITTEDFVETVSVYSITFSDEDLALYDLPETYMSDVDYMNAIMATESEEEETDGETDN